MPRDEGGDDVRRQVVGAHLGELPADVADGRADAVDDECFRGHAIVDRRERPSRTRRRRSGLGR